VLGAGGEGAGQLHSVPISGPLDHSQLRRDLKYTDLSEFFWSEWQDLNLRPPRPERGALPDCATLRQSPPSGEGYTIGLAGLQAARPLAI
jgi:hypothetical protein